ncbi:hypothetical protein B0O80DRAFT_117518 [Mortierella sp. GBAus27b]|nr:hypothetical protein B0O80DRAFT_117518 [Mortierella sp. GBAus27b]
MSPQTRSISATGGGLLLIHIASAAIGNQSPPPPPPPTEKRYTLHPSRDLSLPSPFITGKRQYIAMTFQPTGTPAASDPFDRPSRNLRLRGSHVWQCHPVSSHRTLVWGCIQSAGWKKQIEACCGFVGKNGVPDLSSLFSLSLPFFSHPPLITTVAFTSPIPSSVTTRAVHADRLTWSQTHTAWSPQPTRASLSCSKTCSPRNWCRNHFSHSYTQPSPPAALPWHRITFLWTTNKMDT